VGRKLGRRKGSKDKQQKRGGWGHGAHKILRGESLLVQAQGRVIKVAGGDEYLAGQAVGEGE